uniref:Tetratricopeptide repeat protein 33 n=1 Tax=Callorhinchus milii TaxID=7868 RepID=A0A4W3GWS6_CALMI
GGPVAPPYVRDSELTVQADSVAQRWGVGERRIVRDAVLQAIRCWDEAIQLTPDCAALYEMKAQVLLMLDAVFRAVQVAEVAVRLAPRWWVALQTLGRAQLNMGEISLVWWSSLDKQRESWSDSDLNGRALPQHTLWAPPGLGSHQPAPNTLRN